MPESTVSRCVQGSPETVWQFVQDMGNWAPMITGYQSHQQLSDTQSTWVLRGDVGILSRTVRLDVHITEWIPLQRIRFTLTGLNEVVAGGGVFEMRPMTTEEREMDPPPAPTLSFWARWVRWWLRLFMPAPGLPSPRAAGAAAGGPMTQLDFTLGMEAGGPTGPLVNALLEPALLAAAEDLGSRIVTHLTTIGSGERKNHS